MGAACDGDSNVVPHQIDDLAGRKVRGINTSLSKGHSRLRSGEPDRREFVADIGDLDVVHDDVAVKHLCDGRNLRAIAGNENVIAAIVGNKVSHDTTLGREQEVVDTVSDGKIADVIGDHAVEPADAVFASQYELGLPARVIEAATLQERVKLSRRVAERKPPGDWFGDIRVLITAASTR